MQSWLRETVEGEGGISFGCWGRGENSQEERESGPASWNKWTEEEGKGTVAKTCTCQTFTITFTHTTILYHPQITAQQTGTERLNDVPMSHRSIKI